MRYPTGHRDETRARICAAAARLFRTRGFRNTTVSDIMREAGLTVGGFYAHFSSKEALAAEAVGVAFSQTRQTFLSAAPEQPAGYAWVDSMVKQFLSRSHRDDPGNGCPVTALLSEYSRVDASVRESLESELSVVVERFSKQVSSIPGLDPRQRAIGLLALCAGGVALSRAVVDEELSSEILKACRDFARASVKSRGDSDERTPTQES